MSDEPAADTSPPPHHAGGRSRRPAPPHGPREQLEPREGYTAVGRISKPHGVRGEVRVVTFEPGGPNIGQGRSVFIDERSHRISRARPDRADWILALEGINNRDTAETLRGKLLQIPDSQLRRNDDESYFIHELIGLDVVTDDGLALGKISEVLLTGANDVYVVQGERGEILVPVIASVIHTIDTSVGKVVITPLAGMLDESK